MKWVATKHGPAQLPFQAFRGRNPGRTGPGSTTDLLGRLVAERLGERLGQPVVVENRPGAGGNIGAEAAARAPADGYTLLLGPASTNAINPSLYRNLRFDPIRDFAPVASVSNVLVVPPQLLARTVPELIELARKRDLTFASGGAGGTIHLSGELFKHLARVNMLHVSYAGSAAAMPDLLAGRVDMMFDSLPISLPHIRAGRLRALGVTAARRSPLLPELPTIAEAGLPGYEAEGWYGLFAPAATTRRRRPSPPSTPTACTRSCRSPRDTAWSWSTT
jgi:tripartite-type tricarboxylate transporter receptor subunit TctC